MILTFILTSLEYYANIYHVFFLILACNSIEVHNMITKMNDSSRASEDFVDIYNGN